MGLSRRRFTREFKITAVRRLQQGESVAVLARALEVNPGLLHRGREEYRHEPGKAFPGSGRRGAEAGPGGATGTQGRPAGAGD